MNTKKIITYLAGMAISTSTSFAVVVPSGEEYASQFGELITEISKSGNLLRYEGAEYDVQAYIKEISSTTTPDNIRLGVVSLATNKNIKDNFVHSMGNIQFACAVDPSVAKTLIPGQLVSFHATIAQVQSEMVYSQTIGRNVEQRLVVATCNLNSSAGNAQLGSPITSSQSDVLQDCVAPKSKITTSGLEVLGTAIYKTPDGQKLSSLKENIPFWVEEKKGKWLKLIAAANSAPYKNGEVVGWALESEVTLQDRIGCDL